jgi:hypothetical protein
MTERITAIRKPVCKPGKRKKVPDIGRIRDYLISPLPLEQVLLEI